MNFNRWFKGDPGAVQFAGHLWEACQMWDDLEDEGQTAHNQLLAWLAFGKEYTPFFAAHAHILRPALLQMYLNWSAANALDHGDRNDVAKAYVLRAGIYGVFHVMAWIVGGHDWAEEIGPDIWREYGETPESLWGEMNA